MRWTAPPSFGVSCTGPSDCTAVGQDGNQQPIYVQDSSGTWGTPTEVSGAQGSGGLLTNVSCVSASACTAVGSDSNGQPHCPVHLESDGRAAWGASPERLRKIIWKAHSRRELHNQGEGARLEQPHSAKRDQVAETGYQTLTGATPGRRSS